jgi:hypothetical protein
MGLLSKAAKKADSTGPADLSPAAEKQEGGRDIPVPPEYEAVEGLPGALKDEIIKYCSTYTSVHGIVISYPPHYDAEKEGESFNQQLNRVVTALGTAVPLPSRHSLILFSNTIDRDLLAHRLSKSLEAEIPVIFQSDNAASVVEYIRPYL